MRRALAKSILAGAMAILAGACSIVPKTEPQQVYSLPPVSSDPAAVAEGQALGLSLRVLTPYAGRMLSGTYILVSPGAGELNAYKGVRWSDPAPLLLRNRLVDGFRESAGVASVTNDSAFLSADLALGGDLAHFEVRYEQGAPVVHIQWDALLIEPASSRIVASRRFQVWRSADAPQVPAIVRAFGQAADILASDMVSWTLHQASGVAKRGQE